MANQSQLSRYEDYVLLNRRWLHREAYRICKDWHHAEDLVQATLYKLYARWQYLAPHDQLLRYARRTLVRAYLSERRRLRWSHEVLSGEVPDRASAIPPVEEQVAVRAAVRKLAPRQRAVVVLRFWHDLTVAQTARALGCTEGTVMTHTHRALAAMRPGLRSGALAGVSPNEE